MGAEKFNEGIAIDHFSLLFKSGQIAKLQRELKTLNTKTLPREHRHPLATLCRRANLPFLGLKILSPVIRPTTVINTPATEGETLSYAANLIRIGATTEALSILDKIDPIQWPEVLLQKSFALTGHWQYAASGSILRQYIRSPKINRYERSVGRLNLSAAWIALDKYQQAHMLLEGLLRTADKNKEKLLFVNSALLSAQLAIITNDLDLGAKLISLAESGMSPSDNVYQNLIGKWKVIALLKSQGATPRIMALLNQIRQQAEQLRIWETVRDCDLYRSVYTQDEDLFLQVYFGTPFDIYRKRMLQLVNHQIVIPDFYKWQGQKLNPLNAAPSLDLLNITHEGVPAQMRLKGTTLTLLKNLCLDFYKPFELGSLFSTIYPGEYFNIETSPGRISLLKTRLRKWLADHNLPLQVLSQNKQYRLHFTGPIGIFVSQKLAQTPSHFDKIYEQYIERLKEQWPYQVFTGSQGQKLLHLPKHQFLALVTWAHSQKKIFKSGHRRGTYYRFQK